MTSDSWHLIQFWGKSTVLMKWKIIGGLFVCLFFGWPFFFSLSQIWVVITLSISHINFFLPILMSYSFEIPLWEKQGKSPHNSDSLFWVVIKLLWWLQPTHPFIFYNIFPSAALSRVVLSPLFYVTSLLDPWMLLCHVSWKKFLIFSHCRNYSLYRR